GEGPSGQIQWTISSNQRFLTFDNSSGVVDSAVSTITGSKTSNTWSLRSKGCFVFCEYLISSSSKLINLSALSMGRSPDAMDSASFSNVGLASDASGCGPGRWAKYFPRLIIFRASAREIRIVVVK